MDTSIPFDLALWDAYFHDFPLMDALPAVPITESSSPFPSLPFQPTVAPYHPPAGCAQDGSLWHGHFQPAPPPTHALVHLSPSALAISHGIVGADFALLPAPAGQETSRCSTTGKASTANGRKARQEERNPYPRSVAHQRAEAIAPATNDNTPEAVAPKLKLPKPSSVRIPTSASGRSRAVPTYEVSLANEFMSLAFERKPVRWSNSYFFYRKAWTASNPGCKACDISKESGAAWRVLPAVEREPFVKMSEDDKAAFHRRNPGYRYEPLQDPALQAERAEGERIRHYLMPYALMVEDQAMGGPMFDEYQKRMADMDKKPNLKALVELLCSLRVQHGLAPGDDMTNDDILFSQTVTSPPADTQHLPELESDLTPPTSAVSSDIFSDLAAAPGFGFEYVASASVDVDYLTGPAQSEEQSFGHFDVSFLKELGPNWEISLPVSIPQFDVALEQPETLSIGLERVMKEALELFTQAQHNSQPLTHEQVAEHMVSYPNGSDLNMAAMQAGCVFDDMTFASGWDTNICA